MTGYDIDSEESFMSDGDYSGSTATSVEEDKSLDHRRNTVEVSSLQTQTQAAQARPTSSIASRRSSASINGVPLLGQTKQDVASEVARRIREISQSMDNAPKHVAKPEPRKLSLKKRWRDSFYGGGSSSSSHDSYSSFSPTTPSTPGSRASVVISTPTLKRGSKSSALEISKPISRSNSATKRQATDGVSSPQQQQQQQRNSFHSDHQQQPPTSAQSDNGGLARNASVKYGGRRISGPIEVNGTPDFQTVPLALYNNPSAASLQLSSSHTPAAESNGYVETIEMTSRASHFHSMRRKSDGALLDSITNHHNGRSNSLTATSANETQENPPPTPPTSMLLPPGGRTLNRKPSGLSAAAPAIAHNRLSVQKSSPQLKHKHSSTMSIDETTMEPGLALELERRKVLELKRIATNQNVEKLQLVKQAERDRLLFEETEKLLEGQRVEVSRLAQELEKMERLRKEDKEGHLEVIDSLQRAVHDEKVQAMGVTRQAVEEGVEVETGANDDSANVESANVEASESTLASPDPASSPDTSRPPSADEVAQSIAMATAAMERTTAAETAVAHLESEINHLRLHRDSLRDALTSLRKSSDIEIKSYRDQCMRLEKRLTELEGDKKAAGSAQGKSASSANSLGLKRLSSSSALGKSSLFIRNELYQELFDRDADVVRKIHENIEEEEEGRMSKVPENDAVPERRGVPRFITVVEEE